MEKVFILISSWIFYSFLQELLCNTNFYSWPALDNISDIWTRLNHRFSFPKYHYCFLLLIYFQSQFQGKNVRTLACERTIRTLEWTFHQTQNLSRHNFSSSYYFQLLDLYHYHLMKQSLIKRHCGIILGNKIILGRLILGKFKQIN